MGYCCLPPERVELTVNSKKGTNSMVKMSQESKWARSQNGPRAEMSYCSLPPEKVELTVNSKKNKWYGQNGPRVKIGQGPKWTKIQIGPRVKMGQWLIKMGYCCLPPEKVKLIVNSKKETNGRVKMSQVSKWAESQDGLLLFTP